MRRHALRSNVLLAAFALVSASAIAQASGRLFSVEALLRNEAIRSAQFDPQGRYLIYEYLPPRASPAGLGRVNPHGEEQSKLWVYDLRNGGESRALFPQPDGEGYALRGISPDGAWVLYARFADEAISYGVFETATGRRRELRGTPDCHFTHAPQTPLWISAHEVIYALTADGSQPVGCTGRAHEPRELERLWQASYSGREATVSAVGSGRFKLLPSRPEGQLVRVDVATGEVRKIAEGTYASWFLSPDKTSVAAVRMEPTALDDRVRLDEHTFARGARKSLRLIRLGSNEIRSVCEECADVEPSFVSWSASGRQVGFFARGAGEEWRDSSLWTFDFGTGATTQVRAENLHLALQLDRYPLGAKWAWAGEDVAVLGSLGREPVEAWYVIRHGVARRLLPKISGSATLAGATRRELLLLAGDAVWAARAGTSQKLFTIPDAKSADVWLPPPRFDGVPANAAGGSRGGAIALRVTAPDGSQRLAWYGVNGRLSAQVSIADPRGNVIAALNGHAVAELDLAHSGVSTLSLDRPRGDALTIRTINSHLAAVDAGKLIRLEHRLPDGLPLVSWLLLPPFARAGERLPMVCDVYPGRDNQRNFTAGPSLAERSDLNGYVPAAHGYAILYVGLPMRAAEGEREPAQALVAMVLSAVDAAVATGYIDGDRLAVQGQSNGGFATVSILTGTNRFKAAVAQAGIYDFVSAYGAFNAAETLAVASDGPALNGATWLERGQAGLGHAPWEAPDQYVRNSPLFGVTHIETPLMLLHGDRDPITSITQSEELFSALYRLGKPAVFVRYWGEGHLLFNPENIRDKWRRVLEWYDLNLRVGAVGATQPPSAASSPRLRK